DAGAAAGDAGRDDQRRRQIEEGDDAGLGRTPAGVGVDDDGDPGRPLPEGEEGVCQLQTAEGPGAEDGGEDGEPTAHRGRIARRVVPDVSGRWVGVWRRSGPFGIGWRLRAGHTPRASRLTTHEPL